MLELGKLGESGPDPTFFSSTFHLYSMGFPGGSVVTNRPAMQEM